MKRVEKLAEESARKALFNSDYKTQGNRSLYTDGFQTGYRQALSDAAKLMTVHIDCPNCHAPGLTVDFSHLILALADREEQPETYQCDTCHQAWPDFISWSNHNCRSSK